MCVCVCSLRNMYCKSTCITVCVYVQLEECALQIYRYHSVSQTEYGAYLDLDSVLDEQSEEFEGFADE